MYNETVVNLNKENYIDYLICICGYSKSDAENLANIMYN